MLFHAGSLNICLARFLQRITESTVMLNVFGYGIINVCLTSNFLLHASCSILTYYVISNFGLLHIIKLLQPQESVSIQRRVKCYSLFGTVVFGIRLSRLLISGTTTKVENMVQMLWIDITTTTGLSTMAVFLSISYDWSYLTSFCHLTLERTA